MVIHTRYDELVDPNALKPHPKNANKHPEEQIERLAKILNYQGWRYPIKVSRRSGFVTSGHGRILAAKHLGWTEVPVNYQDYEDEDQEHADVHSDNAIASWAELDLSLINTQMGDFDPGFDLDLLGIKDFTLDMSDKEFGSGEDEVPEAPPEPVVKRGELWILGEHRLLIDDCTSKENVERLMAGEKAELCFTSPPYSDQRDYSGELELTPKHLAKFFAAPCSLFAVNLGMKRDGGEVAPYWNDYIETAKTHGHKFLSWNVWDRGHAYSIGQMTAMFPIEHEWIFVFGLSKDLNLTVPNKSDGEVNDHRGVRQKDGTVHKEKDMKIRSHRPIGTVMRIAPHMSREETRHPAMFPVSLPEEYINACTKSGDSVFEPFSGSGSTLIACEKTNRRCFGMEIDANYGQVIIERWQKFSGKKAVREDGVTFDSLKGGK